MAFFPGFSFSSAFLAPRQAASSFSHRITVQFSTTFAPPISINSSTNSLRNSWETDSHTSVYKLWYFEAVINDNRSINAVMLQTERTVLRFCERSETEGLSRHRRGSRCV